MSYHTRDTFLDYTVNDMSNSSVLTVRLRDASRGGTLRVWYTSMCFAHGGAHHGVYPVMYPQGTDDDDTQAWMDTDVDAGLRPRLLAGVDGVRVEGEARDAVHLATQDDRGHALILPARPLSAGNFFFGDGERDSKHYFVTVGLTPTF